MKKIQSTEDRKQFIFQILIMISVNLQIAATAHADQLPLNKNPLCYIALIEKKFCYSPIIRAIMVFITSVVPPPIVFNRTSTAARQISYSSIYP